MNTDILNTIDSHTDTDVWAVYHGNYVFLCSETDKTGKIIECCDTEFEAQRHANLINMYIDTEKQYFFAK